ncbi:MAG TPA: PaaI family thioesterase, partial [Actinomycetota bacterium]
RHLNLVGLLHGGLIATLADTATGLAYRTVLEPGTRHVTTHLSVTFLSPGRAGLVTARGKVVKAGRRFGYAESDVVGPDGELLARATATFTVSPERAGQ